MTTFAGTSIVLSHRRSGYGLQECATSEGTGFRAFLPSERGKSSSGRPSLASSIKPIVSVRSNYLPGCYQSPYRHLPETIILETCDIILKRHVIARLVSHRHQVNGENVTNPWERVLRGLIPHARRPAPVKPVGSELVLTRAVPLALGLTDENHRGV